MCSTLDCYVRDGVGDRTTMASKTGPRQPRLVNPWRLLEPSRLTARSVTATVRLNISLQSRCGFEICNFSPACTEQRFLLPLLLLCTRSRNRQSSKLNNQQPSSSLKGKMVCSGDKGVLSSGGCYFPITSGLDD